MGDIIEEVQLQQFTICRMRMVDMETQVARGFEQLPRDVAASSADGIQGTCLVMELAKNDAVTELLQLTGSTFFGIAYARPN